MKPTNLLTKCQLLNDLSEETTIALRKAPNGDEKILNSLLEPQIKEIFESFSKKHGVDPEVALFFADAMCKQEAMDASPRKRKKESFCLIDDPDIKTLEKIELINMLALHILGDKILPRTIETYRGAINAMGEEKPLAYVIRKGLSRSRLNVCRAAYARKIMEDIADLINSANNTNDPVEKENNYQEAYEKTAEIAFIWNKAMHGSQSHPQNKKSQKRGNHSKSGTLKNLEDNWRELIIPNIKNETDQVLFTVITLSGCRPSEACGNVLIVKNKETEDRYYFYIKGSKTSETTNGGQPLRKISIDVSNFPIAANVINNWINDHEYSITSKVDSENFGSRVSRVAKKLGMHGVTPYSLRHQTTSDLKSIARDPDQISSTMGHANGKSKSAYGNRRNGKATSGGIILEASASRVVRNERNYWLENIMESNPSDPDPDPSSEPSI